MASAEASSWTVISEDNTETPSTSDLRSALQKGSDDVKLDTLREIIVSTINGNHQVCFIIWNVVQEDSESYALARSVNADHPICYALTKQSIEEASALLLGGLPEV